MKDSKQKQNSIQKSQSGGESLSLSIIAMIVVIFIFLPSWSKDSPPNSNSSSPTSPSLNKKKSFRNEKSVPKGILPELQVTSDNEDEIQKTALKSEVLITKAENEAIKSLEKILIKKKGTPEEPDLLFRLTELYMKRSKSGRFFDLIRKEQKSLPFNPSDIPSEILNESSKKHIKSALDIYLKIEKNHPRFEDMDRVYFFAGFAFQQLHQISKAEEYFLKLVTQFPTSSLAPDSYLSLGEINYDNQKFEKALNFLKQIEKYPKSRIFSYGMYKMAWTYYNMKQSQNAIHKLVEVVKYFEALETPSRMDAKKSEHQDSSAPQSSHNLRKEALRDLALFYEETQNLEKAVDFFKEICSNNIELAETLLILTQILDSHSRYKELQSILSHFLEEYPDSQMSVKYHLLLAQTHENLKKRDNVLQVISKINTLCKNLPKDSPQMPFCEVNYSQWVLDLSKKWWEIWEKNKSNKEFATLTEKLLKLHIESEQTDNPEIKSNYALADLLYQQSIFQEASKYYQKVGKYAKDPQQKHDAQYSAIVSLQKSQPAADKEEVKSLAKTYLKDQDKGLYRLDIEFLVGLIEYEQNHFDESLKYLKPISQQTKNLEFQKKSQDLILDILNAKKDFDEIKKYALSIAESTNNKERQQHLLDLVDQSEFAKIQTQIQNKTGSKEAISNSQNPTLSNEQKEEARQSAQLLYTFFQNNKKSKNAKDSLWQSLSLLYANHFFLEGADRSMEYATQYPNDEKTKKALQDAMKVYIEYGMFNLALKGIEKLEPLSNKAEWYSLLETQSELLWLEKQYPAARKTLEKLIQSTPSHSNKSTSLKIKLFRSFKGQETDPSYKKIESEMVNLKIEPIYSEIQFRKALDLFSKNKFSEAFQLSKNIISNKFNYLPISTTNSSTSRTPNQNEQESSTEITKAQLGFNEIRAKARWIQAQILEKELLDQSIKASLQRLELVLSLKTEKLDKAQSSYLDVLKMSQDPHLHQLSYEGILRCYNNYIESIQSLPEKIQMTNHLSGEEQKSLQQELSQLLTPIQTKKLEYETKLQNLSANRTDTAPNQKDVRKPSDTTQDKALRYPELQPSSLEFSGHWLSLSPSDKCSSKESGKEYTEFSKNIKADQMNRVNHQNEDKRTEKSLHSIYTCIENHSTSIAEQLIHQWLLDHSSLSLHKSWGLFFMSLLSYQSDNVDKALWLINKAQEVGSDGKSNASEPLLSFKKFLEKRGQNAS